MRNKLTDNKRKKLPNKIYFKIVESDHADRYGRRWKYLVDKSGCRWGMFWTYKNAKLAIQCLRKKYKEELDKRGTFTLEELKGK